MRKLSGFWVGVLVLSLLATAPARAVSEGDKKDRLDLSLSQIGSDARTRRYVGGIVLMTLGVAAGVGAIVAASSSDPTAQSTGAAVLGVTGGVFLLAGGAVLLFPTEFERLPESYEAMPFETPEQLHAKVLTGESHLRRLADDARRQRIIEGIMGIALGGAYIVLGATTTDNQVNGGTQWLIYSGVVIAGLGVADLLVERMPEREYLDYSAWQGEKVSLVPSFGVAPLPNGAAASLSWRF